MTNKTLTSGLEDYVEEIYLSEINNIPLKGAELARKLNISRASVSEALSKLVSKKLINYNSYGIITLTKEGYSIAKTVYEKHSILKNFFEKVLDIPLKEASEDACKIEHIISQKTLNKIETFTKFCQKQNILLEEFKKGNY